jgi:hypothetical protein
MKSKREEICKYFLGEYDYSNAQSTKVFIQKVLEVTYERDRLVEELKELHN